LRKSANGMKHPLNPRITRTGEIRCHAKRRYNQVLIRVRARGTLRRFGGGLSGFFSVAV
jgi:hypothetical protein